MNQRSETTMEVISAERNRRSGYSLSVLIVLMLTAAIASGAAVYLWQNPGVLKSNAGEAVGQGPATLRETVQERADGILHAMKNKDFEKLAQYVHPDQGLKFTPYSNVTEKDVTIPAGLLDDAAKNGTKRVWGSYDGSGEPMELTFGEYFEKFVYAKDYLEAPELVFNQATQRGNSVNNIKTAYPDGVSVEYYFPGFDKQYEGMDWRSLTLVFEQKDGIWYLAGVVNGQWTI